MNAGHSRASTWLAHGVAGAILILIVLLSILEIVTSGSTETLAFTATLIVFVSVGWMVASRLPQHPIGWMLMAVPGLFAMQVPFGILGRALLDTAPDVAAWLLWYGGNGGDNWTWLLPVGVLFTQIPLRFPDGRLPSPRWRWFSWFTIGAILIGSAALSTSGAQVEPGVPNPAQIPGVRENAALWIIVFAGLLATSFVGSVASLFVRYRRADEIERAQLRWVLWGSSIPAALLVLSWLTPSDWTFLQLPVSLSYALIPISIAVAVLRYRLYAIDRIISRTAAYALVTLFVVAVYAFVVTSVTWLFPAAPAVGVALATLAAAALFLPVLRWIRRRVDRRFDRARYDAQRVVEQFGERLRTGVDPHTAPDDLAAAVDKALQPTSIGLWTNRPR